MGQTFRKKGQVRVEATTPTYFMHRWKHTQSLLGAAAWKDFPATRAQGGSEPVRSSDLLGSRPSLHEGGKRRSWPGSSVCIEGMLCLLPNICPHMAWGQKGCFLLLEVIGPLSPPMGHRECPSVTPYLSAGLSLGTCTCTNASLCPCVCERVHVSMCVQEPVTAQITNY